MKKLCFLIFALSALLFSCKTTDSVETLPEWVIKKNGTYSPTEGYFAVGSANLGDYKKSVKVAEIKAKKEISQMLNSEIHANLSIRQTDNSKMNTANIFDETSIKSKERVSNSKVEEIYQAKDGTIYVLVHYQP